MEVRRIPLATLAGLLLSLGGIRAQTVLWEQTGPVGAEFGSRLARAGDANGDGIPDLIVAARAWGGPSGPTQFTGKAFLLSGASGSILLEWTGPAPLALFGTTVVGPGDVDGDGTPDVAVGTLFGPGAFVYSGADGSLIQAIAGGKAVGAPGDIDGDGHADVAAAVAPSPALPGSANVYSGADASLLLSIPLPVAAYHFAGPGDLDADGIGDLLVSTPQFCAFGRLCTIPQVFAYSCPSGTLLGEPLGAGPGGVFGGGSYTFGETMAGLGDMTGDGVPDLAIGAPGANSGGYMLGSPGEVRIFSGADFSLQALFPGAGNEALGRGLDGPGDVDGDGVPDLIVGAPGYGFLVGGVEGRARVISGADASLLFDVEPPAGELMALGYAVAGIGDANFDDFPDFAVGSPGILSQPSTSIGKVRAYSGAPVGVAPYGSGCAGSTGAAPRIGATRSPRIGTPFRVNLSETIPSTLALLLLGFTDDHWWGVPLPLDLGFVALPGCSLLVSPDFPVGFTTTAFSGKGRTVAEIELPFDPVLVGASLFAQWYVVDPGPAAIPGALTRALALTVQP
jgi:FG-GAP repeat protein